MITENFQSADGLKPGSLSKTRGSWVEVIFRVAEVGIHEAGKEQAGAQGFGEAVVDSVSSDSRQVQAIGLKTLEKFSQGFRTACQLTAMLIGFEPLNRLAKTCRTFKSRNSRVMPIYRKRGGELLEGLCGVTRASRPVVDAMNGVVVEPGLEPLRVFPQIMQEPGEFSFGLQTERTGKFLRQACYCPEMVPKQLPAPFIRQAMAIGILGGVRVELHL